MQRKEYRDSFVVAHVYDTISAQIRNLRQAHGWTQTELATRCGMKQSRISALEDPDRQNVETKTLMKVASAFDVALSVRFVPFSELAQWAGKLNDAALTPFSYDADALPPENITGKPTFSEVVKGNSISKSTGLFGVGSINRPPLIAITANRAYPNG